MKEQSIRGYGDEPAAYTTSSMVAKYKRLKAEYEKCLEQDKFLTNQGWKLYSKMKDVFHPCDAAYLAVLRAAFVEVGI